MRLQQILEDLVSGTPGGRFAILADWEGEAVVFYPENNGANYHIKVVGAHHGIILDQARELGEKTSQGNARQITFLLQNFHVITTPVTNEYYLVLSLDPQAIPARAQPMIKKAVRELEEEIA